MAKEHELIYGLHAVRHALEQHPESILSVWIQDSKKSGAAIDNIIALSRQAGVHIDYLPRATLDKHTEAAQHQGVVLKRRKDSPGLETDLATLLENADGKARLFLVLDGIQDPQNLGACLRTANAAGVDAVILPRDKAAAITPVVRKVASGAAEHTPVFSVTNLARTLREMQEAGIWIVGTDGDAAQSIFDLDLKVPIAIVLGAEGHGLRLNTRNNCDYLARLPMHGIVESLNVSVATGICLYEVLRQRNSG
jgi:23S rRNA (guanosine2251-2'-O)-methyltransferase